MKSTRNKVGWHQVLKDKKLKGVWIITVVYLLVMVLFLNWFLPYINQRQGIELNDFLLDTLPPVNLSIEIFSVLYLSILVAVVYLINKPIQLLKLAMTLAVMYSLRIITLWLIPLNPPKDYIPLADPFIRHFAYGGDVIVKDLFFSGHTGCMLSLVLCVRQRYLRFFLILAMVGVMIMLLFQHIHYSIDIIGAILLTPFCWFISNKVILYLRRK